MTRKRVIRTAFIFVFSAMLGMTLLGGCSGSEPLPEPVVVAPEPEPEPEPEPPKPKLPLNGEEVDSIDDPRLHVRALAVKIENTPTSRPALGITLADVVYETITEGGITRFNAIFQSEIPEAIGSVRSARNSDVSIVPQYDALFVFSGTNSLVWADLGRSTLSFLEEGTAGKSLYRIKHKSAPHNLYLNTELVFQRFLERWHYIEQPWPKGFEFGDYDTSALEDKDDAVSIFIPYSGRLFDVTWEYYPGSGNYMRFINGVPQVDEGYDKTQIAAENVIVLSVPYVAAPAVPGKGQTFNMNFNGYGDAIFFRDGVRIDCTWQTDGTYPPVFYDLEGNQILMKPGKTWFQVPRDINSVVVTTGHIQYDDPDAVISEETDEEAMNAAIEDGMDE